jgi:hypothetical protein
MPIAANIFPGRRGVNALGAGASPTARGAPAATLPPEQAVRASLFGLPAAAFSPALAGKRRAVVHSNLRLRGGGRAFI